MGKLATSMGLMGLAQGVSKAIEEERRDWKTERMRRADQMMQAYLAQLSAEHGAKERIAKQEFDAGQNALERDSERARWEAEDKRRASEKEEDRAWRAQQAEADRQLREELAGRSASRPTKPTYHTVELPPELGGGYGMVDPVTGQYARDERGQPIKAPPPHRPADPPPPPRNYAAPPQTVKPPDGARIVGRTSGGLDVYELPNGQRIMWSD